MAIDFTLPPEVEESRLKVRDFLDRRVRPREEGLELAFEGRGRDQLIGAIAELRRAAMDAGLWLPQMPKEWGGMGLGPTAVAAISADCAKTMLGTFALGCQAPDEGNMHTLLHFGSAPQKEKFLRPLCEGWGRSCFAMTEPEVSGSDPTLIQTTALLEGDEWVLNGHKWFITGAKGAHFAIVIAKTELEETNPRHRTSAIIVPSDTPGWNVVRDISTMGGSHNHCEIVIDNARVPKENLLGRRGGGHELGQMRLGPARLAHCMRWIGQVERALEMMIDRSLVRFTHGSLLADKQAIQWMIADSGMELYSAKLMVMHAAYRIEAGLPFRTEVSYAKHHVANTLWRVIDRAIQVHGALGYSNDTPLAKMLTNARWARFADGADEVHQMRIAEALIRDYKQTGSVRAATGDLPI